MKSYLVWVSYILLGFVCLNNPSMERLPQQWGFYMMLGSAFVVMHRSGFVNLGMSFQMISSAIAGAWMSYWLEPWFGLWSVIPSVVVFVLAAYLAGWVMVALRCRRNVDAIYVTLTFGLAAAPLSKVILSLREQSVADQSVGTPIRVHNPLVGFSTKLESSVVFSAGLAVVLFTVWWLQKSKWGYQARAFADNPELLPHDAGRTVLVRSLFVASVIVGIAVFYDICVRHGRYQGSLYDETGFLAVAIGLMSFGSARLIPVPALVVCAAQTAYNVLSVTYKLPAHFFPLIFGTMIISTVLIAAKLDRESKSRGEERLRV